MAVSVVAGSAVGTSSSTSISKPTGYTDTTNDLILVQCESSGQTGTTVYPTPPTGFTVIAQRSDATSGNNQTATTWAYKYSSGAGEAWPKSFTAATGSNFDVWNCIIVRGGDTSTPLDGTATTTATSGTSVSLGAITASVSGDLLVIFINDQNDVDATSWPTGVTEYAAGSNATGNGVLVGTKASMASGSTGTLSVTIGSGAGEVQACAVLVKAPSSSGTNWTQSLSDSQSGHDSRFSQTGKNLPVDWLSATDLWANVSTKFLLDVTSATDALSRTPAKLLADYLSATDSRLNTWTKTLADATSAFDGLQKLVVKLLAENTSATDSQTRAVVKRLSDFVSLIASLSTLQGHALVKQLSDWFAETDSVNATKIGNQAWKQTIQDAFSAADALTKTVNKPLGEHISALDVVLKLPTKWLSENISALDAFTRLWVAHLLLQDLFVATDVTTKGVTHRLYDTQAGVDFIQQFAGQLLVLADSFTETDRVGKVALKALAESISSQDALTRQVAKVVLDSLSATDRLTAGRALLLALHDYLAQTDAWTTLHSFPTGVFHLGLVLGTITNLLGIQVALTTPLVGLITNLFVAIHISPSIL